MIAGLIKAIGSHVERGMGGIFQGLVAKEQSAAADTLAAMTDKLGVVEMVMERQRQEAGRQAMADTLRQIDEEYGMSDTPRGQQNRAIIRGMINQLGRAAARPGAEAATQKGGQEAVALRRGTAARGVGGSTAESMARDVVGLAGQRREAVAGERENVEYDISRELNAKRMQARQGASKLGDASGAKVKSPYDEMMTAIMGGSAIKQERLRHLPGMASSALSGIAEGIKLGAEQAEAAEKKREDEAMKKKEAKEKQDKEATGQAEKDIAEYGSLEKAGWV